MRAILFALLLLVSCGQPSSAQPDSNPTDEHAGHGSLKGYAPVAISPDRVQLLGIRSSKVVHGQLSKSLRAVGNVALDETKTSHVHVKFEGFIREIYANYIGQKVEAGDKLFQIYSPDLVAAQEEYAKSLSSLKRLPNGTLMESTKTATKELVEASKRRLQLLDVPSSTIAAIEKSGAAQKYITITAPRAGTILEKQAISGLAVEPMTHLYIISDLSSVWVNTQVYEQDISNLALGQEVTLTLDALPGQSFTGKISFISPTIDEVTRTAKIRFDFDNREGLLKPGMYASVSLSIPLGSGLSVPSDAIIDTGERQIVFVSKGAGHYEPRQVKVGSSLGADTQILEGLIEGEEVVTFGQFLLDSESRLKAAGTSGGGHSGH